MAYTYLGDGSEAELATEAEGRPASRRVGMFMNWVGALMSLAMIAGLTVWGYQLAVRDVTGVPVVRALEGPMRVAPENPGGTQAAHQGLAVNRVAADGTAEAPADRLVLAPPPLTLRDEDLPRAVLTAETDAARAEPETLAEAAPEVAPEADAEAIENAVALADALSDGVTPLAAAIAPAPGTAPAAAGRHGVAQSPRPVPRPSGAAKARVIAAAAPANEVPEADPAALPAGTRLVQFGAYDSPESARAEWDRLAERFEDFLVEKTRVIERAVSGGKTFYRLRAMGFADINDARRFCTTFLAERQPCIPVVTR